MIVHNHLSKIFQKPARIEQGSFLENCYSVTRKSADKAMKYLVWSKLELGVRNVFENWTDQWDTACTNLVNLKPFEPHKKVGALRVGFLITLRKVGREG